MSLMRYKLRKAADFDVALPSLAALRCNGQSNKEAGRELGIAPRTIEVNRARVIDKLGARNTADLSASS